MIGDLVDGALCAGSLATGNWGDAGFDCVAVIPWVGSTIRGARYADEVAGLVRTGDGALDEALTLRHNAAPRPPSWLCSFSADTPVLLADGEHEPISEIQEGDHVWATDPETGESGAREVIATLPHTDQLLTLQLSSGDVVTTEDHRYWNATDHQWQQAQHLDPGDRLLTADGDRVTVEGLDWTTLHNGPAYDLTIADLHTFYVATGDQAVLVHNCNLLQRAAELRARAGSNRVSIDTTNGRLSVDLEGRAHFDKVSGGRSTRRT